ncbi:MAG: hypothetical protein AW10_00093 [Candidatus Accumulibacter appositus]|uniref:Uncharacterized protein n=1 Tax=Candidatus Accumulibacter appositus TaxID=1454003 RepID=A0A011Q1Y9_9PROT|nr:MAG: hypothetical protein AW10_00093 [Candidatus Accumulibacter appositus]
MLPTPDFAGHDRFVGVPREPQQDHIHCPAVGLAGLHRLEQSRHSRAVERRIGCDARALVEQRVVVLEELHFLRIAQRDEDHRVAARRHHAAGQPDHGVLMTPDANAFAEAEAALDIGDRLVARTRDWTPSNEVARLAEVPWLEADKHHAYVAALVFDLHRQIGDVAGFDHPLDAEQGAIGVVAHIRRLGVGAKCVALHDPEIGTTIAQQDASVIDQSAIDPGHRQRDADQQAEPEAGEDELAPAVEDVATGKIDHRLAPTMAATTLTFASGCNACSLCTTTSSPAARPARIWLRPSRVEMPTSTG